MIFKIFRANEWQGFRKTGVFDGSPADIHDGFIHFSTAAQVKTTAAKHFKGEPDLTIAAFDAAGFGAALKWEPSRGGDLFPHLHGALRRERLRWAAPLPLGPDGAHAFPAATFRPATP